MFKKEPKEKEPKEKEPAKNGSRASTVDAFFEENWAEGNVNNLLDYIEEQGVYIRE